MLKPIVILSAICGAGLVWLTSAGQNKVLIRESQPIPRASLAGVNCLQISGSFPPESRGGSRMTNDPRLVVPVLLALESGMVDDPVREAIIREQRPANGFLHLLRLKGPRSDVLVKTIYFDNPEFKTPRYRKQFVDAVTAAYLGGKENVAFWESRH